MSSAPHPKPWKTVPPSPSPACSTKLVSGLSIFRQQEAGTGLGWTVHPTNVPCPVAAPWPYSGPLEPGKGPPGLGAGQNTSPHRPSQADAKPGQTSMSIQGSLWGTGRGPSSPGAHRSQPAAGQCQDQTEAAAAWAPCSLSTCVNTPVGTGHTRAPTSTSPPPPCPHPLTGTPPGGSSELWSRPCPWAAWATSQDKATGQLGGPTHPPAPSPPARVELSVPRTSEASPGPVGSPGLC